MRVNSVLGLILCIKFLYIGIVSELLVWVDYPYVQNISDYRLPLHIAFWKINLRQSKAFVLKVIFLVVTWTWSVCIHLSKLKK